MKKLLISILFVLAGLFVVDRLGGMAMWWVCQHTHDVSGPKIKYLASDVYEDVVLMGTSRCNSHYVPSIISDTLGCSVYNGGIDGSDNIFSHYITLNFILSKHKPKVICLELMPSDFEKQPDPFSTISFFAPYFGKSEGADSVFRLAGKYWEYRISHLYRYNAKAISNIAGLAINRNEGGDHGYLPNPQPAQYPTSLGQGYPITKVDSLKLKYVQKFIDLCRKNNIKLVFVVSPMYVKVDKDYYDPLKAIAARNHVPFMDYHTEGLFLDHPDYFRDSNHLWDKGARLYSSIFASDLKRILKGERCRWY